MRTVLSTLRILIASADDVAEERQRARQVIETLARRYANSFRLQAVLGEEMPLQADAAWQTGVEAVLDEQSGIDIAVFILWCQLGPTLGERFRKAGSGESPAALEREYELMLEALRRSGGARPSLLVYARSDEASFEERLRGRSTAEKAELVGRKLAAERFINNSFHNLKDGSSRGAYHQYDRPITFSDRLRAHLTGLLDALVARDTAEPIWDCDRDGPPFTGLEAFQMHHAPVFAGREGDILEARLALREQARQGCAFILLSGASGSGKSSLGRAGILPAIAEHEVDEQVAAWRILAVAPSELAPDPCAAIVRHLLTLGFLEHLQRDPAARRDLIEGLRRDPVLTIRLSLREPLRRAGAERNGGGHVRLLILMDQLEELLGPPFTESVRTETLQLLEAFARSGCAWVVATVRSDFLGQVQCYPSLVRLLEGRSLLTVRTPPAEALRRIVEEPARFAGLRFEQRGERSLAEQIVTDATERAELLPLLEFVLRELFEQRRGNLLRWDTYQELGGVEGALARCAEEAFGSLPPEAQKSLDDVLGAVVTLGEGSAGGGAEMEERLTRQRAPLATLSGQPAALRFVEVFAAERLFTMDSHPQTGEPTFTVAHEALLRVWRRASAWALRNHDFLLVRARVASRLREGSPILEGDPLLALAMAHLSHRGGGGFSAEQRVFILSSFGAAEGARRRRERLRRHVTVGLSALALVALLLALVATAQMRASRRQQQIALQQKKISTELYTQAVGDVDTVQARYVNGTLLETPGLDDQQLATLQSRLRNLHIQQLQDLQKRNSADTVVALLLARTLVEEAHARLENGEGDAAAGYLQRAESLTQPKADVLQEQAEVYGHALLEQARIHSQQGDLARAADVARENRAPVQGMAQHWPNSWRLAYLLARIDNLIIIAGEHSRADLRPVADRLHELIDISHQQFDPINWWFVVTFNGASTGFTPIPERFEELSRLLSFFRAHVSENAGLSPSELREGAASLKVLIDFLAPWYAAPDAGQTVPARKAILNEAERIMSRLETRLPRNRMVIGMRSTLLDMQRFAARDKANTRDLSDLAEAQEQHRVEATQAGEPEGVISGLALALNDYGEALLQLQKEEVAPPLAAAPVSGADNPFASIDKPKQEAARISLGREEATFKRTQNKEKRDQAAAFIRGSEATVARFSFREMDTLLDKMEVATWIARLRGQKAAAPLVQTLRGFELQYIQLFEKQAPHLRQESAGKMITKTESEISAWFEEERDADITAFWQKALSDLALDNANLPECSGLINLLSLTARSCWRTGREAEAAALVARALALCQAGLALRSWDWYLRQAALQLCFDCGETLGRRGKSEASQQLLREAWSHAQEMTGEPAELSRFSTLPFKGHLPPGLNSSDKRLALFRRFLPVEQGGSSMKQFVIPCDVNGRKVPVQFYILHGSKGYSGLADQIRWLKEFREVDVAPDVQDSLRKLQELALADHVDFQELCTYALNYKKPAAASSGAR